MKKYKYPLIYPRIYRSDKQEGIKVIESGQITMSKITKDFEKRFASYIGSKYAVMVNSGSSANLLALSSLKILYEIPDGSEVITSSVNFPTTMNPIIQNNLKPVLVDVDEELCMSYDKLLNKKNIDAVIFVPLNGRTGDGKKIYNWCKKNKVKL